MDETLHALITHMIDERLAPIQAKLDFFEEEMNRMDERIHELEHQIADMDTGVEIIDAPEDMHNLDETSPMEDVIIEQMLGNKIAPLPSATHVTLTVDLSKKKL